MTTIERLPMVTAVDDMPGPRQGRWTYSDYAALPDDGRYYEVVNGVLFMTPAPNIPHQETVGRLFFHLFGHVEGTRLGRVFVAPIDVELAPNVVVQPDVVVVLNESRGAITEGRIIGAPDLVVEVASPGTRNHDRREKYDAYARAGILEYWIAEPTTRTIEVFVLGTAAYQPLGVFQGKSILPSQLLPGLSVRVEQFFA